MNKSALLVTLLLTGCFDGADIDIDESTPSTSLSTTAETTNATATGVTENDALGVTSEEYVSSEPVTIDGTSFNPEPSPEARLRKNFSGRQKRHAPMINRVAKQYGIEPQLAHAIISQESWYRPSVGSPAGAVGLMQLIPGAGRRFGCSQRQNPECNVRAGVKYLKFLADKFANRGNLQTIASGYNAGEAVAMSYLNGTPLKGKNPRGRQTPNGVPVASFGYSQKQKASCTGVNVMPGYECEGETYHYARNVAGYYLRYKRNPHLIGLKGRKQRPSSKAAARGRI